MLKQVKVDNFGLFHHAHLTPSPKFTVITGTTGSGKSLLFDAIALLCEKGTRRTPPPLHLDRPSQITLTFPDATFVRTSGTPNVYHHNKAKEPHKNIRSQLTHLLALSQQFSSLWATETHTDILYPVLLKEKQRSEMKSLFQKWLTHKKQVQQLRAILASPDTSKSYLQEKITDIETARFEENEEEALIIKQRQLIENGKLSELLMALGSLLDHNAQSSDYIQKVRQRLENAQDLLTEQTFNTLTEALETHSQTNSILTEETSSLAENVLENDDLDKALTACNERLALLRNILQTHNITEQEIPAKLKELQHMLQRLDHLDADLALMEKELESTRKDLLALSEKNAQTCTESGKALGKDIQNVLAKIDMPDCSITVQSALLPEEQWSQYGAHSVTLTIQTNNLQSTPLPPHKILSGGELARFSLAFQAVTLEKQTQISLLFDEIESGLSPNVCQQVGELLARTAQKQQIIVITHSPQIACFADTHFLVTKSKKNNVYQSTLTKLESQENRMQELIRMLSGDSHNHNAHNLIADLINHSRHIQHDK
ncbi:MAG: AAA family ATPase [Alphaproteobacteria bacterium]|nr:AAA family ATPase [Alphaproteobacteria bacterium]